MPARLHKRFDFTHLLIFTASQSIHFLAQLLENPVWPQRRTVRRLKVIYKSPRYEPYFSDATRIEKDETVVRCCCEVREGTRSQRQEQASSAECIIGQLQAVVHMMVIYESPSTASLARTTASARVYARALGVGRSANQRTSTDAQRYVVNCIALPHMGFINHTISLYSEF